MILDENLFEDEKRLYRGKAYRLRNKLTFDKVCDDLLKGVGSNKKRYTIKGNLDPKYNVKIKNIISNKIDPKTNKRKSYEDFIFNADDLTDAKEYFDDKGLETKEIFNGSEKNYSLLIAMPDEMFVESYKGNLRNASKKTVRKYINSLAKKYDNMFKSTSKKKVKEDLTQDMLQDLKDADKQYDLDKEADRQAKVELAKQGIVKESVSKDKLKELADKYNCTVRILDDNGEAFWIEGDKDKRDAFFNEYINLSNSLHEDIVKSIEKLDPEVQREVDFVFASNDQGYGYKMLSRLKSDNDYILGALKDNSKDGKVSLESINRFLWFHDIDKQIAFMKAIYERLDEKPEWISLEDIDSYKKELKDLVKEESIKENINGEKTLKLSRQDALDAFEDLEQSPDWYINHYNADFKLNDEELIIKAEEDKLKEIIKDYHLEDYGVKIKENMKEEFSYKDFIDKKAIKYKGYFIDPFTIEKLYVGDKEYPGYTKYTIRTKDNAGIADRMENNEPHFVEFETLEDAKAFIDGREIKNEGKHQSNKIQIIGEELRGKKISIYNGGYDIIIPDLIGKKIRTPYGDIGTVTDIDYKTGIILFDIPNKKGRFVHVFDLPKYELIESQENLSRDLNQDIVVSTFKDGNDTHRIVKAANGKFFNDYSLVPTNNYNVFSPSSSAGGFDTEEEAEKMLLKHHPKAVKVSNESLKEELSPEEQKDYGITTLINNLIKDELEAIDGYNSAIVTLAAEGKEEFNDIIKDIISEENVHIGQLQTILSQLSNDSIVDIEKGQLEGQTQLEDNKQAEGEIKTIKDVELEDSALQG